MPSGRRTTTTLFNVTRDSVVARQAQVVDQRPPVAGEPRVAYTPVLPEPPAWWADARIPFHTGDAA